MLRPQPIHLYVRRTNNPSHGLNPEEFRNLSDFTLRHNEQHLLVTDLGPNIYRAFIADDADNTPLSFDEQPEQLAFCIRLNLLGIKFFVGKRTKLSTLLNLNCIHVDTFVWTLDQMMQMTPGFVP